MKTQNIIQAIVVLVVIAAAVFVAMNQTLPPDALPASAPATEFSAERAIEHIKVIAQGIRIPGTPEYAKPRDYVMGELTALGLKPEAALSEELRDRVPELYTIGDCVEPRRLINAIWEAYRTARLI